MPEFTQEIEIEPYEYIKKCSKIEIQELIDELEKMGYIKRNSRLKNNEVVTQNNTSNFNDMLIKIIENKHQLTNEDEQLIIKIYNKII